MAEDSNKQPQTFMPSDEVLKSQLLRQRTMARGFRFPLKTEEAYRLLYTAYAAEVQLRGRKLSMDAETTRVVAETARFLTSPQGIKTGMMFCGTCGNGKTTLMNAIGNSLEWMRNHDIFVDSENKDLYDYLTILDAKRIATDMKNDTVASKIKRNTLLGIEDMGREPAEVLDYGNVFSPIVDLLEYRYSSRLFTIITTNLTSSQIREKYGMRVADRLNEMLHVVVFRNTSFR